MAEEYEDDKTYIQVAGVHEEDGECVGLVADSEATQYGVYIGRPGDFMWHADFAEKQPALDYAKLLAKAHDAELDDRTYSEVME